MSAHNLARIESINTEITMAHPPIIRDIVYRTLHEHGPMSAHELSVTTGLRRSKINGCINKAKPLKMFYICDWVRQESGQKGAIIPIYKIGNRRDVPKIEPLDSKERNARYRDRHKAIIRVRDAHRRKSPLIDNPFMQLMQSVL